MDRRAPRTAATSAPSPSSARADPALPVASRAGVWWTASSWEPDPAAIRHEAPPAERVRSAFFVAAVALGAAALVHLLRYLLLVINRNTLLNWMVADAAALLCVLASLAAVAAVMACAIC